MDTRYQQTNTNKNEKDDNSVLWTIGGIIVLAIVAYAVYATSNRNRYAMPVDRAPVTSTTTSGTTNTNSANTPTPAPATESTTTQPNNTTTQ